MEAEKQHFCKICKSAFETMSELRTHVLVHTEADSNSCGKCCMPFADTALLISHLLFSHTEIRRYSCKTCGALFKFPSSLNTHNLMHTSGSFVCGLCDNKTFQSAVGLENHMATHAEQSEIPTIQQSKHLCSTCKKSFTTAYRLKEHSRKHTGDKLTCGICKNQFNHETTLRQHLKLHSGEGVLSCDVCRKMFTSPSALKRHSSVHSTDREFQCKNCEKRFKTQRILDRHELIARVKPESCTRESSQ